MATAIGALQVQQGAGSGGSTGFIPYANAGQAALTVPASSYQASPLSTVNHAAPAGSVAPGGAPSNLTSSNGGGSGGGAATGFNSGAVGQAYDQQIGNFQGQLNQLPTYQDIDSNIINKDYGVQQGGLQQQYQTGQANQQLAQNQLDLSHTNSVRDLGNQLRGALAGYQNQLGVQGAGNSSAAGLLGYALQQQGNTGMNDLNDQYNNQETGLNIAGSNLDSQFQQNMKALDQWKGDNLQQIAEKYAQQAQQLQQAMLGASTSKVQALSYQNQALAQAALTQMQGLEGQYANQTQNLHAAYQQAQAPTQDISQYANAFNVNPLSTQQVQATNFNNNQQNTNAGAANIPVSLQKQPNNLTLPS